MATPSHDQASRVSGGSQMAACNTWQKAATTPSAGSHLSPIRVVALTRDSESRNWGRLLEVEDVDGRKHRWAMPATLLASTRCEERRQNLLSLGAQLANTRDAVGALHRYLCATVDFEGRTLPRATAATRLGWHGNYFVLPDRALGGPDEVVYQSTSQIRPVIRSRRTLEEWQARVAKLAAGNTRLELALSVRRGCTAPGRPSNGRDGRPFLRRIVDRKDFMQQWARL